MFRPQSFIFICAYSIYCTYFLRRYIHVVAISKYCRTIRIRSERQTCVYPRCVYAPKDGMLVELRGGIAVRRTLLLHILFKQIIVSKNETPSFSKYGKRGISEIHCKYPPHETYFITSFSATEQVNTEKIRCALSIERKVILGKGRK